MLSKVQYMLLLTNSDVVIVHSVGERLQTYMVGDTDILGWFWKWRASDGETPAREILLVRLFTHKTAGLNPVWATLTVFKQADRVSADLCDRSRYICLLPVNVSSAGAESAPRSVYFGIREPVVQSDALQSTRKCLYTPSAVLTRRETSRCYKRDKKYSPILTCYLK